MTQSLLPTPDSNGVYNFPDGCRVLRSRYRLDKWAADWDGGTDHGFDTPELAAEFLARHAVGPYGVPVTDGPIGRK